MWNFVQKELKIYPVKSIWVAILNSKCMLNHLIVKQKITKIQLFSCKLSWPIHVLSKHNTDFDPTCLNKIKIEVYKLNVFIKIVFRYSCPLKFLM